jgi:hypothetical protein
LVIPLEFPAQLKNIDGLMLAGMCHPICTKPLYPDGALEPHAAHTRPAI